MKYTRINITKYIGGIYTENYKILPREINKDLKMTKTDTVFMNCKTQYC